MQELFAVKGVLVLNSQDAGAGSDDPLEIHLLRRGWNLRRVRALQDSISEKMTIDMFDGTTEALDAAEVELQGDIDQYLGGIS